jgi:glycosyltransferase involved in cell wall biosynthesis
MKILWLCSWFPNDLDAFGGDFIERHAKSLALHHPVDVIHVVQNQALSSLNNTGSSVKNYHGLRVMVHTLPVFRSGIGLFNKTIFNVSYFLRLRRILDDYVKSYGKPDIVHVHVPVKIGVGAIYLQRKYHIPFVITEHNSAYFPHIPGHYHSLNPYYKWVVRKSFQKATGVSSVSQWLTDRIQYLFNPASIKIIRNSVDTLLFYYSPATKRKKRFIHVSMMDSLKNVEGIISAFIDINKNNDEWELVLVGPVTDDMKMMIRNGGIENRVIITGLIPYHEVAAQMRQADALVHFSRYENLPCVINEALCCGLTVISSDVGGISEIISRDNGILVKSEDVNGLKQAIIHYLNNHHAYDREKTAMEASSAFNYHTIGLELLKWYQELLK